jgi:hypothetical protein
MIATGRTGVGHAPDSAVVLLTRATFAAVALIAIVPVASGVGKGLTPLALNDSAIRKYCPGWITTFPKAVTCQAVPVAAAYCTDHPFTEMGVLLRLNNSMKSFW